MRHLLSNIFLLIICLSSFAAKADNSLQLSAGLSFWSSTPDGSFGQTADSVLTLDKKSGVQYNYYFTIEHQVKFVPNVKFSQTTTSNESSSTLSQTFLFNDNLFRVASVLDVESTYEQFDVITYFEVLDTRTFEFDLGMTLRQHSIHNQVANQSDSSESTFSKISDIELLAFVAGKLNLPLLNVGMFVETSFLDTSTYDIQTGISYAVYKTELVETYLQFGVKKQNLEFTNLDGVYTQLNWQAMFIGMEAHF
jgi:outer membrane protein